MKLPLSTIASGFNASALNANFERIEDEFQNKVLYRDNPDGEPNTMEQLLDMNNNDIINTNAIRTSSLFVNGQEIEASNAVAVATLIELNYTATEGQTVFSTGSYNANQAAVIVVVDGFVLRSIDVTYTSTSVTIPAQPAGTEVTIFVFMRNIEGAPSTTSDLVSHDGVSLEDIANNAKTLTGYTALRAYSGSATSIRLTSSLVAGNFELDASDTTTADNGGTVIVDANGGRWKRAVFDKVYVSWFGALGNENEDATAINNAITYASTSNAKTVIYNGRHKISSNITVKKGVRLCGPSAFLGSEQSTEEEVIFDDMPALLLNGATINLESGASLERVLVYRFGMTFPIADESAYTGTAVTINTGDGASILDSMFMGFEYAVYATQSQGLRFRGVKFDCTNGFYIEDSTDISHLYDCYGWPYAAVNTGGWTALQMARAGIAFHVSVQNPGTGASVNIVDCFDYGYKIGLKLEGTNSCEIVSYWSDSFGTDTDSYGIQVVGNAYGGSYNKLIGPMVTGKQHGILVNTNAGAQVQISNPKLWNNTVAAAGSGNGKNLWVQNGDCYVTGGAINGGDTGVYVNNIASRVFLDGGLTITNLSGFYQPILNDGSSPYVSYGEVDFTDSPVGTVPLGNAKLPTLTVAATTNLFATGRVFNLPASGTTITGFAGGFLGREITLIAGGAVTLQNGGAAPNGLQLPSSPLVLASGDVVRLLHNGSKWVQI